MKWHPNKSKHRFEKYGRAEVETWWWQLWNEPNIGYWSGTNAYTLWKALGEPQKPTAAQYAELEQAGKLTTLGPPTTTPVTDHAATIRFTLPRQGVSLLVFESER